MTRGKTKTNFREMVVSDAHRQQSAAASYGHLLLPNNISVFAPEPAGRITLDFIPYTVSDPHHPDQDKATGRAMADTLWYKRPYRIHRVGMGQERKSYVCLASIGKKCPICEFRAKRMRENAPKEETDSMRSSLRNLYMVIPIGMRDLKETLMVFDISQYNFQKLLNQELEENPDNGIFPDLEEGKSLRIRFESRSIAGGNPYPEASRIDFIARSEPYDEAILDDVPDLDKMLKVYDYDELYDIFFELQGEPDAGKLDTDNQEEDAPVKSYRRSGKQTAPADDDTADEEKDTPPPRRGARAAKPVETEPVEEEQPKQTERSRTRNRERTQDLPKDRCPHGHVFGVDTDRFDDCDTCKLIDDCYDAKEAK